MHHEVRLRMAESCPTAVVAQETTWEELPALWGRLLDEVYTFLRDGGATQEGHNIMLYRDDVPNVEVGVQVTRPFIAAGRLVASVLPAGHVATTVHRGSYDHLDAAHRAVRVWCAAQGHELTGTRWEIYGDWHESPDDLETEICYLLR